MIDVHATLGEQFFDVAVGQPVAEIPPDGQQNHIRREPVAGKRSGDGTVAAIHSGTL